MFYRSFLLEFVVGISKFRSQRFFVFQQFLVECLVHEYFLLGGSLFDNLLGFLFDRHRLFSIGNRIKRYSTGVRDSPLLRVERGFEYRSHRVVVQLRNGIVAMVMALSTSDADT